MLATLVDGIPKDEQNYVYELKYDGFRATAASSGGSVAIWSRNSLDLSARFPHLAPALETLDADDAVLDGEIVSLDAKGTPRFQNLQRGDTSTILVVFDILWLNGRDLRKVALEQRREILEHLLESPPRSVRLAEVIARKPKQALDLAGKRQFEGLIAKRKGSPYENRRSKLWLKIKAITGQELAIIGYTPAANSSREIGALLLGVVDDGVMRFAGKVGTGFTSKMRADLMKDLSGDRIEKSPAAGAPRMKAATWVKPRLVAQVRFTEWTSDGKLRHPSFLGLRPDKKPEECVLELPASAAKPKKTRTKKTASSGARGAIEVRFTNLERVLYPRDRITKRDVAEYYASVAEPVIRTLRDRPLALEHWNNGIDQPSWFHQNLGPEAQPWMTLIETPTRTSSRNVRHLVVDRPETLQWLAQNSVLTMHMWSARGKNLESPDWMVFDLDPAKGKGIEQAIEAAIVLRRLFEQLEIPSVPKTSGKRGIHVFVPLKGGHTHDAAVDFACRISETLAKSLDFATTERALSQRRGRLYVDCLQNGYGKTVVAPYSLRAIDGAPVSTPLRWDEVKKGLDPLRFNIRTVPERIARHGDLFAPVLENGIRLPKLR